MDTPNSASPWRFAPLDPKRGNPQNLPELAGIVFDVDGTLCESLVIQSSGIDFA